MQDSLVLESGLATFSRSQIEGFSFYLFKAYSSFSIGCIYPMEYNVWCKELKRFMIDDFDDVVYVLYCV